MANAWSASLSGGLAESPSGVQGKATGGVLGDSIPLKLAVVL